MTRYSCFWVAQACQSYGAELAKLSSAVGTAEEYCSEASSELTRMPDVQDVPVLHDVIFAFEP